MKTIPQLLVVDDDPNFLMVVSHALIDAGYDVHKASDGEEAVQAIREHSFDLALLDIKLPKIDGIEVLKIIRKEAPSIECVMMTGYQDVQLAVEAIKLGAREFLQKPMMIDELAQRLKTVLRAHSAEAHVQELQAEFTSKLLHNLLTPLHTLRSALDFLADGTAGPITDHQKKILQGIDNTIKMMNNLLNDMIDLNLFESGHVSIERIPTNFDELIPAVCARFIPQASAKHIEMKITVDENTPTIAVDPDKIEQVMNNLLENALKFTSEGGNIEVRASTTNYNFENLMRECIEVEVADSGTGIAAAELPFVFDKYKEVLVDKHSESKTTGLGLAICRSIIEAHQGKMLVESEVGKGSTIKFLIPV